MTVFVIGAAALQVGHAQQLSLSAGSSSLLEGQSTSISVSVPSNAAPASDLTVGFSFGGNASGGCPVTPIHSFDYCIASSVTITAGNTSASTTLQSFSGNNGNRTVRITAAASGYVTSNTISVTIRDRARLSLVAGASSISEPTGSTTITVSIPSGWASSSAISVGLSHSGTASVGSDYTVGSLTIPAYSTSGTATVSVVDDDVYEQWEQIRLRASASGFSSSSYESIGLVDDEPPPPPPLTLVAGATSISEPAGSMTITVSVPSGSVSSTAVSVGFSHTGTATVGSDYTVGSLIIAANQASATATVAVVDDDEYEQGESIRLIASATGYRSSAAVVIALQDDDPAPLSLGASAGSVSEPDGAATLTVSVPAGAEPTADLTVEAVHSGTAAVGADYALTALMIAAGERSGTATLTVVDDETYEGGETIAVTVSAVGYRSSAAVVIALQDDDPAPLSLGASAGSVSEPDGAATLTVSVPAGAEPTADLTVEAAHSGSAAVGADYALTALMIAAGERSGTATLTVVDDETYEGGETIAVTVSAVGYRSSAAVVIALQDDDPAPLSLGASAGSVSEPDGAATVTVSVPAGAEPTADLTVEAAHSGSAAVGADYALTALMIAAGERSGTATLTVVDDETYEGGETITIVAVAEGYESTAPLTITLKDDDLAPLSIRVSEGRVSEPLGVATVTVSVPAGAEPAADLTVEAAHSGTAAVGADYALTALMIAAGERSGTATLTVVDDETYEGDETIAVTVSAAGYESSVPMRVILQDDEPGDGGPSLTLRSSTAAVSEPDGTATLIVSVPAGAEPAADLAVEAAHSGTAAVGEDYTLRTLMIAAGERFGTATLTVVDDETYEGDETIAVAVSAAGYQSSAPVTVILQDDEPGDGGPSLTLRSTAAAVSEPDGTATLIVSVPAGAEPAADLAVEAAHSGTAAVGEDYTLRTLMIAAGERFGTATLAVVDDETYEGGETIAVTVSAAGYESSAPVTIILQDDEPGDGGPSLTLRSTAAAVSEPDGTATITVSVAAGREPESDLLITLAAAGTARRAVDYDVVGLTIAAGQEFAAAALIVLDDDQYEGDETITLVALAEGYRSSAPLTVILEDDDLEGGGPSLTLRSTAAAVSEPDGTATITVSVPAGQEPESDLLITLAHSGSATAVLDYAVGALTIGTGRGSGSATVTVVDDDQYEGDETITLDVRAEGYRSSAPLTIVLEDDDPAALSLSASAGSVSEPDGVATLTVSVPRGAEPGRSLTVSLVYSGTAVRSVDYVTGPPTIAPGQESGTATLAVVDDETYEGDETITIVAVAEGYESTAPLTITLKDDDPSSELTQLQVAFEQAAYTAYEAGEAVAVVLRLRPPADRRVAVPLRISHAGGATADDYAGVPGEVVFEPGMDAVTLRVSAAADVRDEPDESLTLAFGELPDGVHPGPQAATVIRLTQDPRNSLVSESLQPALAVVAAAAAADVLRAVEARFDRHRQAERTEDQGFRVPIFESPSSLVPGDAGTNPEGPRGAALFETPPSVAPAGFNLQRPSASAPGLSPVLWGQVDLRRFSGAGQDGTFDYDGGHSAAHLGADLFSGRRVLAGVSFMRGWGDIQYTQNGRGREARTILNTFHPYVYWQPSDRFSVWLIGGAGSGVVELSDAERRFSPNASLQMVSVGSRAILFDRTDSELNVKADAFVVRLGTAARPDLTAGLGNAKRVRAMLEFVQHRPIGLSRSLSLRVEGGGRFDASAPIAGSAGEAGVQIRVLDRDGGWDLAVHGRTVLIHELGHQDWGIGVQGSWDPGEPEQGWRVALLSSRGQHAQGRTAFWGRPAGGGGFFGPSAVPRRIETTVSYGLSGRGGRGRIAPYTQIAPWGDGAQVRIGLDWRAVAPLDSAPLTFGVETVQGSREGGGGVRFRLVLPFF